MKPPRPSLRIAVELLLAVAIAVGANHLAARHYARSDWTRGHTFALSPKTVQVLRALDKPVNVIVFMLPSGDNASELYPDVHELLERARRVSSKLHVEYVDVDREPERAKIVGKKYGVSGDDLVNGVIVVDAGTQSVGPPDTTSPAAQGRSKFITRDELADYDYSTVDEGRPPELKAWKGEQALIAAILAVTEAKAPLLCFTQGHGEPSLDSTEPGEYGDFAEELRRDHDRVRGIDLSTAVARGIPEDCDLTIIAGPEQPFGPADRESIEKLLERGGRLLALLGPSFDPQVTHFASIGLEDLLERWGADLRNDLVIDVPRLRGAIAFAISDGYSSHPITAHLGHHRTVWSDTREVRAAPKPGLDAHELIHTTSDGWGETDLSIFHADAALAYDPQKDVKGPISIGVAVRRTEGTGKGARLVVLGSSEIAGNRAVLGYNRDLLLSSVAWLLDEAPKVAIGPRTPEHLRLALDDGQLRHVFYVCVLGLPLLALLLGAGVFLTRRS
ncbi:MAG TPA: Gldg family protein [Polyangia bacterium]